MNDNDVVKFQNVSLNYQSLKVLDDISFDIVRGETVSIVGPSGCGKSTILKLLSGTLKTSSGNISYETSTPSQAQKHGTFGFVPQNHSLFEWKNVRENIELPLKISNKYTQESTLIMDKLLKIFKLKDFEHYLPSQISGGMKARVAIARSLVSNPDVLLLDECFSSLDELTRELLYKELCVEWSKLETSILLVTHSIPEAVFLSNKVIVLSPLPARIKGIVNIAENRKRVPSFLGSSEFVRASKEIRNFLGLE